MRHRGWTVLIVTVVALSLLGGSVWASGQTAKGEEKPQAVAIPKAGALDWNLDTSPVTMKIFLDGPQGPFKGWGNDAVTTEITKRTGVTIEVSSASTTDHTQLNMMMASGDLPDFIGAISEPTRNTLWSQGFLEPLNKLAEKYAPTFKRILPADMDKIWSETDGNLYVIPSYYSDIDKIKNTKGALLTVGQMAMSNVMYDALGQPAYTTLADYKKVLLMAKEKYPSLPYYTYTVLGPDTSTSIGQTMNRIFGGEPVKNITPQGTVHMNFRDEAYQKGIRVINDWFRSGLFNPENFTITTTPQFDKIATDHQIFAYFGQAFGIYKYDSTENKGKYSACKIPQEPGYTFHNVNVCTGIGGGGLGITTKAKNPKRAMYYLEFLVSDEGQMLFYHGIEGVHYTYVDGMPKRTPEIQEVAKDFSKLQALGIVNYNVGWCPSMWVDQMYYYHIVGNLYEYRTDAKWNVPYARNERLNDIIRVPGDSEEKVIETQVIDLWRNSLPSIYTAATEAAAMNAYNDFISKAERLGLAKLETAYTKDHQQWKQKLGVR